MKDEETTVTTRGRYAGAEWLLAQGKQLSPLGRDVADLLGEWLLGIYHMERPVLRADWSNPQCITLTFRASSMSTFDDAWLTRLVLLAHHLAIRCELNAVGPRCFRLLFHRRRRTGHTFQRHPTIGQAVATFTKYCSLPEVTEG